MKYVIARTEWCILLINPHGMLRLGPPCLSRFWQMLLLPRWPPTTTPGQELFTQTGYCMNSWHITHQKISCGSCRYSLCQLSRKGNLRATQKGATHLPLKWRWPYNTYLSAGKIQLCSSDGLGDCWQSQPCHQTTWKLCLHWGTPTGSCLPHFTRFKDWITILPTIQCLFLQYIKIQEIFIEAVN